MVTFSPLWLVDPKIDSVFAQLSDKQVTSLQALWDRPPGREKAVKVRKRVKKLEVRG